MIEKINKLILIKINNFWEFPAGSVVRIRHSYSCGLSSTSQAKWHSRKKKKLRIPVQQKPTLKGKGLVTEGALMLRKIEGRRRRGQQRMRWLDGITDSIGHKFEQAPGDSEGHGSPACCSPWGCTESDMTE